jgi:hypothetical protein
LPAAFLEFSPAPPFLPPILVDVYFDANDVQGVTNGWDEKKKWIVFDDLIHEMIMPPPMRAVTIVTNLVLHASKLGEQYFKVL